MFPSNLTAQAIDDALAESFPASDPPAWTAAIARPAPESQTELAVARLSVAGAIELSRQDEERLPRFPVKRHISR